MRDAEPDEPNEPNEPNEPITAWIQAWSEHPSDDLPTSFIVVDDAVARELASTHARAFEIAAVTTAAGAEQLTREIPNVSEDSLADLDERGLVRVGARVRPGSLLVGKVSPTGEGLPSPEEKLLRAIFGEKAGELRDTSLRCPPGCHGRVREARLNEPGEGEIAVAQVVVSWDRPLVVGDGLIIEGGASRVAHAVVARITSLDGGGVAWAGGGGSIRVAKQSMAQDLIHARSIGPYATVTQTPPSGREQFGGQLVSPRQAAALAERAPWTAWELFTIKSDSVGGRTRAYEALVKRQSPELPAAPRAQTTAEPTEPADIFSLFERPKPASWRDGDVPSETSTSVDVIVRELAALGIEVRLSAAQIEARLLNPDELRERSHGEVTKPETIDYRTTKPATDGLFCQRIFGPVSDYACACGKYARMKHRGVVCEHCGVEVIASRARRERAAHITLAVPVVHPLFLAEVALLLSLSLAQLNNVLAGSLGLDLGGDTSTGVQPIDVDAASAQTNAVAVRSALAAIDLDELSRSDDPDRRTLATRLRERGMAPIQFVLELIPVLPPDLRPIVPLGGGRFATADLNDLYRRVINRNNRTRRLVELNAPAIILRNESAMLQTAVGQLFDNERTSKPVKAEDHVLHSIAATLEQRLATLPQRCVDYSGVAVVVADPQLEPGRCRVPWSMALELFKPITYGIMEFEGSVTTIRAAKAAVEQGLDYALAATEAASRERPAILLSDAGLVVREIELWDAPAIAVDPQTARLLAGTARRPSVCVHVPLSEEAIRECRGLADIGTFVDVGSASASGWLSRAVLEGNGLARVCEAVIAGHVDTVEQPVLRAALGRGPG
ncbi:hypothetical protein [Enhygromyxa salina]|uniref:DNA-directed RNA polymerase subunit n=1 Tax=Enhygromyxa salina TaxID=215803 RepID=A0A2S9YY04_9BACT|nr:hypothetical protein [Enhygromyxa salina]PRQ09976.1 DNA-directed RNA polymerase subunit beta' [Enhygromyxa salina]